MTSHPIIQGQYIIGVYNYKGRRIEAECDITLTVTACYKGDGACEGRNQHVVFQTTTGWFLGLFLLAGLPVFCFIPFFYCIRRLRIAHQRRRGGADEMEWAAGQGHPHRRPRANPGLTSEQIASMPSFVFEPANADQSMRHPNLSVDLCSVCLVGFEAGEMYVNHCCATKFSGSDIGHDVTC